MIRKAKLADIPRIAEIAALAHRLPHLPAQKHPAAPPARPRMLRYKLSCDL